MKEEFKDKCLYVYNPVDGSTDLVLITDLIKAFKLEHKSINLNKKK